MTYPPSAVRIVYYTDTREIGGAEQNLVDMARIAVEANLDVWLLAPQAELVAWISERVPGAQVLRVGDDLYVEAQSPAVRVRLLLRQVRRLGGVLRTLQPSILHVNNGGFPGSDLCRLAPLTARIAGVSRRLMTVHSNPWPRDHSSSVAWVQSAADAFVWPNVDAVLCPSDAVRRGLRDRRGAPDHLLRVLHYGVDEPPTSGRIDRLRGRLAPRDEILVGMVSARPVPEKGYDVFADALRQVHEGIRGTLVGPVPEGALGGILRALDGTLVLEGVVRPIGDHYRAFDLLVVPSTEEECMPLVILEAMAAGTAVAGSELSGIPEAVDHGTTGWTFPPGDADALAALLHRAREERQSLPGLGAAGRRRWERLFTPARMRSELLAAYDLS